MTNPLKPASRVRVLQGYETSHPYPYPQHTLAETLRVHPTLEHNYPHRTLEMLTSWSAVSLGWSGVVLDLCEDWDTINLPLWILEDILVYHKWTSSEAADPRFIDFSPS